MVFNPVRVPLISGFGSVLVLSLRRSGLAFKALHAQGVRWVYIRVSESANVLKASMVDVGSVLVGCSVVAVSQFGIIVFSSDSVARFRGVAKNVETLVAVPAGIVTILLGIFCAVTAV